MYRTQFPDLDFLRNCVVARAGSGEGWPTCILHVKTRQEYRPDIRGPLSLFINLKGRSHCKVGSHQALVDDQHYFLTNSGDHYDLLIDDAVPTETFNIHIEERLTEQVLAGLTISEDRLLDQPDMLRPEKTGFFSQLYRRDPHIDRLMQEIVRQHGQDGTDRLLLQEQMSQLLVHLMDVHLQTMKRLDRIGATRPGTRVEIYRRLALARDFLHSNLQNELQLEDLAMVACMSRFHFLRAFRQTFRCTPYQYLKDLRMEKARKLLRSSDVPIGDIGYALGYQNLSSFSRVFRQVEGLAPGSYRIQMRGLAAQP